MGLGGAHQTFSGVGGRDKIHSIFQITIKIFWGITTKGGTWTLPGKLPTNVVSYVEYKNENETSVTFLLILFLLLRLISFPDSSFTPSPIIESTPFQHVVLKQQLFPVNNLIPEVIEITHLFLTSTTSIIVKFSYKFSLFHSPVSDLSWITWLQILQDSLHPYILKENKLFPKLALSLFTSLSVLFGYSPKFTTLI